MKLLFITIINNVISETIKHCKWGKTEEKSRIGVLQYTQWYNKLEV